MTHYRRESNLVPWSYPGYDARMRSNWRYSRVILAGLSLGLAMLICVYWPPQPCWKISLPDQSLLGFCPSMNILLVAPDRFREQLNAELRAIDKDEPVRPSSTSYDIYGLDLGTGERVLLQQIAGAEQFHRMHDLSSNGEYLVVSGSDAKHFAVINLMTGEHLFRVEHPVREVFLLSTFSEDGRWFAFATRNRVEVWDLVNKCRTHRIELSSLELKQFVERNHGQYWELGKTLSGHYVGFGHQQKQPVSCIEPSRCSDCFRHEYHATGWAILQPGCSSIPDR